MGRVNRTHCNCALVLLAIASCKHADEPISNRPVKQLEPGTLRFAVIGDFGANTPAEAEVAALVKGWKPDFVITTGDNNYLEGEPSRIDESIGKFYAQFIGNYHGRFGPGSQVNRFWPSPGNHDWRGDGLGPYIEYFTLPGNERYYDVEIGLVHLYALDSDPHEPDGTIVTSIQAKFLKEHLAESKSCYDLVYFHHPPYSSGKHGSSPEMRWPFKQWGAEGVLSGHDHTYERLNVEGLPYFVIGLGGASQYEFGGPPLPETQTRYNEGYGAMLITAAPSGITYEFFTTDGIKRDSLTIPGNCNR